MPPIVSVVIPTYNRAFCVADTLRSVFQQTYPHLEALLIDDGSTDGTADLVAQQFQAEPRLRYVRQANQGVSAARNHGLRLAEGAYVALLDSDDLWQPWKLELQVACMERFPELVMTWTDMDAINPEGKVVATCYLRQMYHAYHWFHNQPPLPRTAALAELAPALAATVGSALLHMGDLYSAMIMGNLVHTSTTLLRRPLLERIGGFDEKMRWAGEDYDFHLRTCREGPVGLLDVPTILYQTGWQDRITRPENNLHFARGYLHSLRTALARDGDRIRLPKQMIAGAQASAHAWIGEELLRQGQRGEARQHLWQSVRCDPRRLRSYGLLLASVLPQALVKAGARCLRRLRGHAG